VSDNVGGTGDLHINAYIKQSGMVLHPPMNLPPEFGEPPKDLAEADIHYHLDVIREGRNSIVLKGYEAVYASIAILRDALQRKSVLKSIRKPSREELKELRKAVDKIDCWLLQETAE
jgi:preprotein translocase subunit Sss1